MAGIVVLPDSPEYESLRRPAIALLGFVTLQRLVERTRELVLLARPMAVTFHRAFDLVRDPCAELEVLIGLGIERVLTSGGAASALEGLDGLLALVDQARGRIVILPGGGVRAHTAAEILARTGARELHSSQAFQIPGNE